MDTKLVEEAICKAIRGGAVQATGNALMPPDSEPNLIAAPLIPHSNVRRAVSSALVTALDFGPIFYWPSEGADSDEAGHAFQ